MRIIELRLQGIGPFVEQQIVNFERFEQSGIFLLEGPTGTGKSSVIDALVYALYGAVSGNDRQAEQRIRSTYCSDEQPSQVELVFETTSGVYQVERSPAYSVKGRKNLKPSLARLSRVTLDGQGNTVDIEVVASKVKETNQAVEQLLGLDLNQFLQTVVLPQGKFSTFLMATSEERQKILQEIFGTGLYEDIQAIFQRLSRELKQESDKQLSIVQTRFDTLADSTQRLDLHNIDAIVGSFFYGDDGSSEEASPTAGPTAQMVDKEVRSALSLSDEELSSFLAEIDLKAKEQQRALELSVMAAEKELATQQQKTAELADKTRLIEQLSLVEGRIRQLDLASEKVKLTEIKIEGARRAQKPYVAFNTWQATTREHELNQVVASQRYEELGELLQKPGYALFWKQTVKESALEDLSDLKSVGIDNFATIAKKLPLSTAEVLVARLDQKKGHLAALMQDQTQAEALREQISQLKDERKQLEDQKNLVKHELENQAKEISVLQKFLDETKDLDKIQIEVQHRVQRIQEQLEKWKTRGRIQADLDAQQALLHQAIQVASKFQDQEFQLRNQWMASAAGMIAKDLLPDSPCPVCGALEHPHPASFSEDLVTIDQVEDATKDRQTADQQVQKIQQRCVALETELAAIIPQESQTEEQLLEQHTQLGDEVEEIALKQKRRLDTESTLADLREQQIILQETLHEFGKKQAAVGESHKEKLSRVVDLERSLTKAALPFQNLAEKESALIQLRGQLWSLREALKDWKESTASIERQSENLENALIDAGYQNSDRARTQVIEQWIPEEELAELVDTISQHHAAKAEALRQQSELHESMKEIRLSVKENLDQVTQEHDRQKLKMERLKKELQDLNSETVRWRVLFQSYQRDGQQLVKVIKTWDSLRAKAEPLQRLANLANATGPENLQKIPLASYVLMRRFDEVLAAANPRLLDFSGNKYQLVRRLEGKDGNRKTGLGLEIFDNETENKRSPQTLSGGEGFYASLALALGLAEVVTAEAGGFDLGTIFIDEGFGSLDSETLDVVMKHLENLRGGGRMVGVISHVPEMKTRILDGVEVRRQKTGMGSTLRLRGQL